MAYVARKNGEEWISAEIATFMAKFPRARLEDVIWAFGTKKKIYKESTIRTQWARIKARDA